MGKDKLNIVYLGYSSFPYGLAEFQKILLISKALVYEGVSVKVIGSSGSNSPKLYPNMKKVGHFQGIVYLYSWGTPYRISGFLKRNIRKPFEKVLEFMALYKINKKDKIDAAIISSMNFRNVILYRLFSRILGFKILLNFVEHNSSMAHHGKSIGIRINDHLFDHYAVKISDGVLVISEFLINIIKKTAPDKTFLKIPMMVDADRYNGLVKTHGENYFLFCGAASYKEIIYFIIKSFELIESDTTFLYLVVNGTLEQRNEVEKHIASSRKSNKIKMLNNVSDKKLSELYLNAIGLLIPLRPTVQDEARFPHKFGEYLISGNPVITTNYGEVRYYFKDMVNALIAEKYDEKEFADKMEYVSSHPSECKIIGENGKNVALEYADYKKYGKRIINYINELK
jgi:glycosyltransferase involved in cell wall biosynthesis